MSSSPIEVQDVTDNWHRLSLFRREPMLLGGTVLALCLAISLWLILTSKRRQRRARHHSHRSRQFGMNPGTTNEDPALAMPRRRKWRRRRRDHRPRNPTLAETGGLPPIRRDGPSQTAP
jgi:uncharacterized membrane protein YccC